MSRLSAAPASVSNGRADRIRSAWLILAGRLAFNGLF
jgi:hypothetical protein